VNDDVTPTETQSSSHLCRPPISGTMKSDRNHDGCLGSKSMLTLEARLEDFIFKRCQETDPQPQRVTRLNAIFRDIYNDRRFWRYRNEGNRDYYENAISLMWEYFSLNLCEATTARKGSSGSNLFLRIYFFKWIVESNSHSLIRYAFAKIFSPLSFLETRTYAVGRLLTYLDGQLKNIQKRRQKEAFIQVQSRIDDDGIVRDPVDEVPNPEPEVTSLQTEAFLKLLEEDPTGELNNKANTLCGKKVTTQEPYALTAQTYLLMRHRDDKTIQQIADELGIPRGTLQGRGKPTKWKELERKLAEMAMDSVSV
jgi:hypothetical protein